MHQMIFAAVGLVLLRASTPAAAAGGGEAGALQAARLNALAGGPLSERDRELLERYGCESGTPICEHGRPYHRAYYRARKRIYRH